MKCVFHIHTIFSSDGFIRLEALYEKACRTGIHALVITDHNCIEGALRFRTRHSDIQVVVGEEIDTSEGEVIGLFLEQPIQRGLTPEETVRQIRQQNGLVCLPHPCDRFRPSTLTEGARQRLLKQVDLIEVFNAGTWRSQYDRDAAALADRAGIPRIWGSDAHNLEELGRTYMEMPPFTTPQEFLSSVKAAAATPVKVALRQRIVSRWRKMFGTADYLNLWERGFLAVQRTMFRLIGGGHVPLTRVWEMSQSLVEKVRQSGFQPDLVVGIESGGFLPARWLAEALNVPCRCLRVSHPQVRLGRMDTDDMIGALLIRDTLMGDEPVLIAGLEEGDDVSRRAGKILLVDDDATSGRTLRVALDHLSKENVEVKLATLRVLGNSTPFPHFFAQDNRHFVFRHHRFPWIKHSPEYRRYARLREQMES